MRISKLKGIPRTLLAPLACRAIESQRTDAILHDPCAEQVYRALGGTPDFLMGMGTMDMFVTAMRARQIDTYAREFLASNPGGLVVDVGCGLDTRFDRINDNKFTWIGLDLPEVIELRRSVLPDSQRCSTLAHSLLDTSWLGKINPENKPVIFLAEGVFLYFSGAELRPVIESMSQRFPAGELVFDAAAPFIVRHHNRTSKLLKQTGLQLRWDVKNPQELETWGLKLLDQRYYFDEPEPRLHSYAWMRLIPFLANATGVFHYRLS